MNKERLLKLADHLERGQLGHKKFHFGYYNELEETEEEELAGIIAEFDEKGCGTMGCALGECPIVFPELWVFNEYADPVIPFDGISLSSVTPIRSAMAFFEISSDEAYHLFIPHNQLTDVFGGVSLSSLATKEEVAANIRAFVAKKEEGEK